MNDRTKKPFWIAVTVLAGLCALLLALRGAAAHRASRPELVAPALFAAEPRCTLNGEPARVYAYQSYRAARARWERVPYALNDGANAVLQLQEAVQCFRAAGDREGRAAAQSDLTLWKRELERTYVRSRLNLTLAMRADDHHASAREAKNLLALLAKAGPGADPYRVFLAGVERASRAALVEQLRAAEEN